MRHRRTAAALAVSLCALTSQSLATPRGYERVVQRVAGMVGDDRANEAASAQGLQLLDVLWEDTGRWEGSSVGPNISDVTIEVEGWRSGQRHRSYLMPVLRHDNFTDRTADVPLDKILIPVGNQRAGGLQIVSLRELLANPGQYMSASDRGKIKNGSLLAPRDSHALVSAQHAFLPVPKEGQATFWPVVFNYQSTRNSPAVLTILVTRQGTSMTVIDNARDAVDSQGMGGQRLFFNKEGKKAPLIAERLADVQAAGTTANGEQAASLGEDANVLMLIQVPLVHRGAARMSAASGGAMPPAPPPAAPMAAAANSARGRSDVDVAVLGHGKTEGPFVELDGRTIERDRRFPVRVTLQFYQATSNGVVSSADVRRMAAQIKKVYGKGDYVGSLVVPSGADRQRPTNWDGVRRAFVYSWNEFPGLVERAARQATQRPTIGVQ